MRHILALKLLIISYQPEQFNQVFSGLRAKGHELHFTSINRQHELAKALCSDQEYDTILYSPSTCSISSTTLLDTLSRFTHTPPLIKFINETTERGQHLLSQEKFDAVITDKNNAQLCMLLPQLVEQFLLKKENRALSFQLNALQRHHERLFMQSSLPQAYLADGIYQSCNAAYLDFFQLSSEEDLVHTSILDHIEKEFREKVRDLLSTPIIKGSTLDLAFTSQHCDFEKVVGTFQPEYFRAQDCLHLTLKSNTPRSQSPTKSTEVMPRDLLTEMDNRQTFLKRVERAIHSTNSKSSFKLLIVIQTCELLISQHEDNLASTNQLLRNLGKLLQTSTRNPYSVGRLGLFEFGLLVSEQRLDDSFALAESIKKEINAHFSTAQEASLDSICTIGLSTITDCSLVAEELVSRSRNNLLNFQSQLQTSDTSSLHRKDGLHQTIEELAKTLKKTIEKNDISFLFQPFISFKEGREAIYEVQPRLRDKHGHFIHPELFLPTVNLQGLDETLDRAVILKIVQNSAPAQYSDKVMLINLSSNSINSETFLPWLHRTLVENPINTSLVMVLQVNEILFNHRLETSLAFCDKLKELGIRVALTHFGKTLEPFKFLRRIEPFCVAIDGSIIKNIPSKSQHLKNFNYIITELHSQGYKTAVQNIDDMDTLPFFWESGVDLAQGLCLQKPSTEMTYNIIHEQEITLGARPGSFI